MMSTLKCIFLATFLMLTFTSCYRMPGENEFSTIPCVNNPDITRAKESSEPAMKY